MNPQYMQQQHPLYRAPPTNGPYGELNANFPPKGQHDLHSYPPQKSPGPPPNNALPPLSNAPPPTSNSRPPSSNALPPMSNAIPPMNNAVPPMNNAVPPMNNPVPPMNNSVPSTSNAVSMNNAVPPTSNAVSMNNAVPPTSSAPPVSRASYYANDVQGQATNIQQINQNNLVNQMSSMALSTQQRPPSSQGSLPPEKSASPMPFTPVVNGINNENHYYPEDKSRSIPQKSLQNQQGSPTSQMSSLPYSYGHPPGSQLPGQQQFPVPNQMLSQNSISGPNIPRSTPQPVTPSPTEQYNQVPNQRYGGSITPQTDVAGPPVSGKRPGMPLSTPNTATQQSFGAPPLSGQTQPGSLQQIPLGPPTLSSQHHMSGPPLGGPPLSGPPLGGPPLSGPPLSGPSLSGPPMSGPPKNRQNLTNPQLSGQNLQGSLNSGMSNLSRPPLSGQVNNLSGPPVSTQSNLANPYGQQNMSGLSSLSGQQNLCSHYPQSNQLPEQRKFSPSPSGQPSAYGHVNHPHSDLNYHQGYQQQNYSQSEQSNMYGNQASPYQGGMGSPTGGYQSNAQAQQARRLDPDQMPSPIQVIQDDQKMKGGVFTTNQTGLVPPLVTTKFTVEDQGNASPRFIRSSMYTVPTTADIIKQTQVPFALILSPMAQVEEGEYEPPVVDMGEIGPVRCNRCKAYMSPFMQFIDAGRRFQCLFCKGTTEVPSEYFQHLDHTGQRLDRFERPELLLGTFEYLATKDYCRKNTFPKPPAIIFVIDVSYNTVKSGLVNLLCGHMKRIIRNLPVDIGQSKSNMKVGFITYSNTVQFYNLKANLAQPQMMIVGDVQDVFMPLLDGFLCDPEESEALIDSLMSQIPTMFGDTRETEVILAPAIQAGLDALKASECTGKLMVFHSSLPITEAPGKLKNRDDRKLLGTDKEKTVLAPQTNFYNNLGQDCVGVGCSVDLFVFNNSYVDIATIGQVSRLTGGEIYKYTYFQAEIDGERLITDIINNVSRPVAFDAVMRVRTSTGVRPTDFYGHLYMSNTTDIELASIDCDKAIAVEIKHDDKLSEEEAVYVQAALLYTSCSGVRRLRIINLSLKTSAQMSELYRACDLDAIINYLSKKSVFKLVDSCPKTVKDSLNSRCAAILASYRKHCATPSSAGQLILPECMKLLPLYINGLLKSDAIAGGSGITVDQKSYVMMTVATMPISESVVHVYPRLLPLHDVDPQDIDLPPMLRCSIDKFTDDGAYLLENGIHMFLWMGSNLSSQWVQSVFGATTIAQVDTDRCAIPILENSLNKRIRHIISYVQSERRYCMRLTLLRQRDKMEMVMRQFLVEDRGADGSQSYVDFLCHMHREIRTLLS